jgi:hypothetical protein
MTALLLMTEFMQFAIPIIYLLTITTLVYGCGILFEKFLVHWIQRALAYKAIIKFRRIPSRNSVQESLRSMKIRTRDIKFPKAYRLVMQD